MLVDVANTICTVIVTVDGKMKDIESVIDHASEGLSKFSEFDGFIAGATHISNERNRMIQYLQWINKEAYAACMNDASWEVLDSSKHFISLMKTGAIKVNVQTYEVAKSIN